MSLQMTVGSLTLLGVESPNCLSWYLQPPPVVSGEEEAEPEDISTQPRRLAKWGESHLGGRLGPYRKRASKLLPEAPKFVCMRKRPSLLKKSFKAAENSEVLDHKCIQISVLTSMAQGLLYTGQIKLENKISYPFQASIYYI